MSERYSRLFALPENLYTVGSPVIIAAGTLLKDTQTGKIIAQLKLKSISAKEIKAVKVKLDLFDTAGNPLEDSVVYDYLDLNVSRDIEFGQKNPVMVPNAKTRSYKASVTEVVFDDRSVWTMDEEKWEPLSNPSLLVFDDPEMLRQYEIKFGKNSAYEPKVEKDLWHCTCGALNHDGEMCHICHNTLLALQTVDMAELTAEKDARLDKEAQIAAENARKAAEKKAAKEAAANKVKKTVAKFLKIAIPVTCTVITVFLLLTKVKYNDAVALMETDVVEAYEALLAMDGYKDSTEKAASIYEEYKLVKLNNAVIGGYVIFGAYEQDNNTSNGKEEVEWLVLDKQEDKILVISRYALDCQQYNPARIDGATWESCALREWLNNDFINNAFSASEQAMIPTVMVPADKNPSYGTDPGNATQDRVFLLSITEANKYFSSSETRKCAPTDYAIAQGAWVSDSVFTDERGVCWWWLRSPGENHHHAAGINGAGGIAKGDRHNFEKDKAVRPAMWITLDS